MNFRCFALVASAVGLLCFGSETKDAKAAVVTYSFTGIFTSAGGFGDWVGITTGDIFSGQFSFDGSVVGVVNAVTATYPTGLLELSVEGITFKLGATFDERAIGIQHGSAPESWSLKNSDSEPGGSAATANGSVIDSLIQSIEFRTDQNSDVYPDFGSPLSTTSFVFLQAADKNSEGVILSSANGLGYLTSISLVPAIPIPAALPLLASGLGILGFVGWCRRRNETVAAV